MLHHNRNALEKADLNRFWVEEMLADDSWAKPFPPYCDYRKNTGKVYSNTWLSLGTALLWIMELNFLPLIAGWSKVSEAELLKKFAHVYIGQMQVLLSKRTTFKICEI
jgi:hypothetical protein